MTYRVILELSMVTNALNSTSAGMNTVNVGVGRGAVSKDFGRSVGYGNSDGSIGRDSIKGEIQSGVSTAGFGKSMKAGSGGLGDSERQASMNMRNGAGDEHLNEFQRANVESVRRFTV
jgi:hypothetical protein